MSLSMSLIQRGGELVKSLNRSLVLSIPEVDDVPDNVVCYLGSQGEEDLENVTFCKDLPDGKMPMVGTWYIHPDRHFAESLLVGVACLLVIRSIVPRLVFPADEDVVCLRPPNVLRFAMVLFSVSMLVYKSCGYPGKIFMIAMPCNMIQCLHAFLALYPKPLPPRATHVICQLLIVFAGLPVVAVATPDLSDLTLPFEIEYFFFSHACLILVPWYYVLSGKVSTFPNDNEQTLVGSFLKWTLLGFAVSSLFYFVVASPLGIMVGINLNYMLSPPPSPGDFIAGPNFRMYSLICIILLFTTFRGLITLVEGTLRKFGILLNYSNNNNTVVLEEESKSAKKNI
jgi:hypothetical protein